MAKNASTFASQNSLATGKNRLMRNLRKTYMKNTTKNAPQIAGRSHS
jgi:hypothetical protein